MHTQRYRKRGNGGGIACDVTAEMIPGLPVESAGQIHLHRKVFVEAPARINWKDLAWLCFGLSTGADHLAAGYPAGLLIRVHELRFPLSDYRAEVAALAMDQWLAEVAGTPASGFGVSFDDEGLPVFDWGRHDDPFSDPW